MLLVQINHGSQVLHFDTHACLFSIYRDIMMTRCSSSAKMLCIISKVKRVKCCRLHDSYNPLRHTFSYFSILLLSILLPSLRKLSLLSDILLRYQLTPNKNVEQPISHNTSKSETFCNTCNNCLSGCQVARLSSYQVVRLSGCQAKVVRLSRCRLSGGRLSGCKDVRLYSSQVVRLSGCNAVRSSGCQVVMLSGRQAVRL